MSRRCASATRRGAKRRHWEGGGRRCGRQGRHVGLMLTTPGDERARRGGRGGRGHMYRTGMVCRTHGGLHRPSKRPNAPAREAWTSVREGDRRRHGIVTNGPWPGGRTTILSVDRRTTSARTRGCPGGPVCARASGGHRAGPVLVAGSGQGLHRRGPIGLPVVLSRRVRWDRSPALDRVRVAGMLGVPRADVAGPPRALADAWRTLRVAAIRTVRPELRGRTMMSS